MKSYQKPTETVSSSVVEADVVASAPYVLIVFFVVYTSVRVPAEADATLLPFMYLTTINDDALEE